MRNTVVKIGLELVAVCQKEATTPDIEHRITESVSTCTSKVFLMFESVNDENSADKGKNLLFIFMLPISGLWKLTYLSACVCDLLMIPFRVYLTSSVEMFSVQTKFCAKCS